MPSPPYDLLIVSDVHLTDGRNPVAGEDHLVPELVKFLAAHERHRAPGRRYRLVVNGDLFDFLHVRLRHAEDVPFPLTPSERERGPGTGEEKSVWKLRRILDANAPFLEALGRFLRAGNEAVLLPGNHDLELYWPAVRAEVVRAVIEAGAGEEGGARLSFKPWCYYEPGVVYIEHGAQFDSDNRAMRWLAPEVPEEPGVLELPPGSIINRYFTHRLDLGPFVGDTSQSAFGYSIWMMKQFGVLKFFELFQWYLSFVWRVTTWAGHRSARVEAANALHRERRAEVERNEGMPSGSLAHIDGVAPPSVMSTKWRMLQRTMFPRVVMGLFAVLVPLLILVLGGLEAGPLTAAAATFLVPMAALTANRGKYIGVADRFYPAAAEAAREVLGVRHVVFGHQHIARAEKPEEGQRRYFNLGCWIEGEGFEKVPLHYLEIRLDAEPVAELRRWPSHMARKVVEPRELVAAAE